MSDHTLMVSNCLDCSELPKINSLCLNCPNLMCYKCETNIHNNKEHDIIKLKKCPPIEWSDRELILSLFEDKVFGNSIYDEINRKNEIQVESNENFTDQWKCTECTTFNSPRDNKCWACFMYRKIENTGQNECKLKLEKLLTKIREIENGIGYQVDVNFEHVSKEYISAGIDNDNFEKWFQEKYLNGRWLPLINEVIDLEGHNVSSKRLDQVYSERVAEQNKVIKQHLPKSLVTNSTSDNSLIDLKEVNKRNIVPDELKSKEITDTDLWEVIIQTEKYTESQNRMIITEMDLPSLDKLQLLRVFVCDKSFGDYLKETIQNGRVTLCQLRQALLEYMTIEEAFNFLRKECNMCNDEFPMPEIQSFLTCTHEMCKTCFKSWIEETIERKYPCNWGCPFCPAEKFQNTDRNLYSFHLRNFLIENKSVDKIVKIFNEKLLYDQLKESKFFHWCCNEQCEFGFEAEGVKGKAKCMSCKAEMCLDCNRKWSDKHENITCEEYEMLMLKDDPNLANILKDIGIECPKCGMRYALAAGGCLHFDCKACATKFCGACYTLFTNECKEKGCTMGTGFHGHHPRNCIYFLRDNSSAVLEKMLATSDYPKLKDKPAKQCPFVITDKGTMKDINCNKDVFGTTGLCEDHYKEYLVQFINRLMVDPADYSNSNELNLMLFQALKPKLEILPNEDENAFVARLKVEVKKCPLYKPKGIQEKPVVANVVAAN